MVEMFGDSGHCEESGSQSDPLIVGRLHTNCVPYDMYTAQLEGEGGRGRCPQFLVGRSLVENNVFAEKPYRFCR